MSTLISFLYHNIIKFLTFNHKIFSCYSDLTGSNIHLLTLFWRYASKCGHSPFLEPSFSKMIHSIVLILLATPMPTTTLLHKKNQNFICAWATELVKKWSKNTWSGACKSIIKLFLSYLKLSISISSSHCKYCKDTVSEVTVYLWIN